MENISKKSTFFEIIGCPGAGKTTLVNEILKNHPGVKPVNASSIGASFFLVSSLLSIQSIPQFFLSQFGKLKNTRPKLADFVALYQLNRWKLHLGKLIHNNSKYKIIDDGPVGLLSWSIGFGSDFYKQYQANLLFGQYYDYFSESLDAIIFLQIPSDLALDRIRSRDKDHWIGRMPDEAAIRLLDRIQCAQTLTLSLLSVRSRDLEIIKLDVKNQSPQDLYNEIPVCKRINFEWLFENEEFDNSIPLDIYDIGC